MLGPLVMGSHIVLWWAWILVALFSTCTSHSGYHLPFMPSPEYHDFHHLAFSCNYGAMRILDWLHGTDAAYRQSVESLRDHTIGLKSAREEVPDASPVVVVVGGGAKAE